MTNEAELSEAVASSLRGRLEEEAEQLDAQLRELGRNANARLYLDLSRKPPGRDDGDGAERA